MIDLSPDGNRLKRKSKVVLPIHCDGQILSFMS
jgi:hypothetical protein